MLMVIQLSVLFVLAVLLGMILEEWIEFIAHPLGISEIIAARTISAILFWIGAYVIILHSFPSMGETWARKAFVLLLPALLLPLLPLLPIAVLTMYFAVSYMIGGPGGF